MLGQVILKDYLKNTKDPSSHDIRPIKVIGPLSYDFRSNNNSKGRVKNTKKPLENVDLVSVEHDVRSNNIKGLFKKY
jgi:hypothetical protein